MKRIIVLMLACLMLLSVVPFSVFAEEDVHENEVETEETTEQVECPKAKTLTTKTHTVTAVKVKAPQCGERGYTLYSCTCSELFLGSYVEAAEGETHDMELVDEKVAPTCRDAGSEAKYYCSACDTYFGGETIPATGKHVYVKKGEAIVCEFCGVDQKDIGVCESEEAVNGEHDWDYTKYSSFVAPTCAKEGSAVIKCANEGCKVTKTIVIEATGDHKYGDLIKAEDPTCTTAGWEAHYICKTCNHYFNTSFKDVVKDSKGNDKAYDPAIKKLGHKYACTDNAAVVDCLTCKTEVSREEATVQHSALKVIDTKATCTTYGVLVHTCAACGLNETVSKTEPTGHKFSEEFVVDDSNKCGLIINVHKCENVDANTNVACTETKKVPTNSAVHTWENKVIVKATCTLKQVVGNVCTVCDFADESSFVYGTINSQNHVNKAGVEVKADPIVDATCTQAGSGLLVCDACGVQEIVVIPAKGHDFDYFNGEDEINVGCDYDLVEGETATAKCSVCEYTVANAKIVVPAHVKGEKLDSGKANCSHAAFVEYDCTGCETNIIEYTGEKLPYDPAKDTYSTLAEAEKIHGVGALELAAASTAANSCETLGMVYYACANCNQVVRVIPVGAGAPHTYPDWYRCDVTVDPDTNMATIPGANGPVELGVLDCEVCGAKLAVLTAEHKWVLDTESVGPDGKKLTYAAVCEKIGNDHFVCENAYCTATKDVVVSALTHKKVTVNAGMDASCLLPSVPKVKKCTLCGVEFKDEVQEANGHSFANPLIVNPTCEKPGFTFVECTVCMFEYAKTVTEATGHVNAEGKNPVYACDDEVKDRTCTNAWCDYSSKNYKVPTHTTKTGTTVVGTCTTQGYTIEICTKCDKYENIVLDSNFGVHKYATDETDGIYKNMTDAKILADVKTKVTTEPGRQTLADNGVIYTPVLFKDGKIEFACVYCHAIDDTKTIVVSAEDELKDNYSKTIGMTLAVDNANKAGAGFSDSSVIAVTVNLSTLNEVGVWGINFNFTYKTDRLVYLDYAFAEDSVFTGYANVADNLEYDERTTDDISNVVLKANDYITYDADKELYTVHTAKATSTIKVGTNVANDENGKIVNATVNGEDLAVVTLYFKVVDKFVGSLISVDEGYDVTDEIYGAFQVTAVTAYDKDAEDVNVKADKAVDVEVEQYLDINGDTAVNFADVLAVWKMISGETEVDYNVVVDVDKNGAVEAADFMAIYSYILGEVEYDALVA